MKKQQKEQIKKGGELARALYQTYMAQPQWMTHIRKESVISILRRVIDLQEEEVTLMRLKAALLASSILETENEGRKAVIAELKERAELLEHAYNKMDDLSEVKTLLRLLEGSHPLYNAPQRVMADFSMYCRDN